MVHVKLSKLIAAAGLAAAGLAGFSGVASASSAPAAVVTCATGATTDTTVTSQVPCDPPACTEGVLTIVTDDSGVQHEACVASSAVSETAIAIVPVRATLAPPAPQAATADRTLPATGAGTGGLIIAAVLVGSGSVVSLLSRRRPSGSRKGFRRRNVTP